MTPPAVSRPSTSPAHRPSKPMEAESLVRCAAHMRCVIRNSSHSVAIALGDTSADCSGGFSCVRVHVRASIHARAPVHLSMHVCMHMGALLCVPIGRFALGAINASYTGSLLLCYKFAFEQQPHASPTPFILFPHVRVAILRYDGVEPSRTPTLRPQLQPQPHPGPTPNPNPGMMAWSHAAQRSAARPT